jgi:hypothetical protein
MLTRLHSWFTGAPGREALPAYVDADVALTQLIGEAYGAMVDEVSETGEARRIFEETNQLQVQLARRASDYDGYRPELEGELHRLRSELYSLMRDTRK